MAYRMAFKAHLDSIVGAGGPAGDDGRVAGSSADLHTWRCGRVAVPAVGVVGPPAHPEVRQLARCLCHEEEEDDPRKQPQAARLDVQPHGLAGSQLVGRLALLHIISRHHGGLHVQSGRPERQEHEQR